MNADQSVDERYPSALLAACDIETTGVELPVATLTGPLPVTFVTVPAVGVEGCHAEPFQLKTWPLVGAVDATVFPCILLTTVAPWVPVTSPLRAGISLVVKALKDGAPVDALGAANT